MEEPPQQREVPHRPGVGDETGRVIVLREWGMVLGWLEYRLAPGYTCEVVNVEVRSENRRQGVGRRLLGSLEEIVTGGAGSAPASRVIFGFTTEENAIAQSFYRAAGFRLVKLEDYYGEGQHAWMFHKMLPKKGG